MTPPVQHNFSSSRTAEEERNDVTGIEIGTEQRCETQESNSADELPTLDDLMKSEPTIKATQPSHEVVKYNDRDSDLGSFVRVSSETVTVNPTDQSVAGKKVQSYIQKILSQF